MAKRSNIWHVPTKLSVKNHTTISAEDFIQIIIINQVLCILENLIFSSSMMTDIEKTRASTIKIFKNSKKMFFLISFSALIPAIYIQYNITIVYTIQYNITIIYTIQYIIVINILYLVTTYTRNIPYSIDYNIQYIIVINILYIVTTYTINILYSIIIIYYITRYSTVTPIIMIYQQL